MKKIKTLTMLSAKTLAATAGLLISVSSASAAWIIPVSATASGEQDANTGATLAVNGSGLSAENASATHAVGNFSWSMKQGDGTLIQDEFIIVDLGALYNLTDVHLWQFTRGLSSDDNRGIRNFDILVSADGGSYTVAASNLLMTQAPDVDANNIIDGPVSAQSFALVQSNVRYVQFGIDGTYETSTGNRDWQGGFGEIRLEGTPIPEPSSTMLIGLSGVLFTLRRKRCA